MGNQCLRQHQRDMEVKNLYFSTSRSSKSVSTMALTVDQVTALPSKPSESTSKHNPLGWGFLSAVAIEHISLLSHKGSVMAKKETDKNKQ